MVCIHLRERNLLLRFEEPIYKNISIKLEMQYGLMKNEVINFIDTNSFVEKHQNHGEKVMYSSDKRGDKPFEQFEKKKIENKRRRVKIKSVSKMLGHKRVCSIKKRDTLEVSK